MTRTRFSLVFALSLATATLPLASQPVAAEPEAPVIEGRIELELSEAPGSDLPRRLTGRAKLTLERPLPDALRPMSPPVLQVVVVPWAELVVDDERKGRVSSTQLALGPGEHTLRLEHPDYVPYRRKLSLLPGQTLRVIVDLAEEAVRR